MMKKIGMKMTGKMTMKNFDDENLVDEWNDNFEEAMEELRQLCWDKGFDRYNLTVDDCFIHKTIKEGFNLAPDTLQIVFDISENEYHSIKILDEEQNIDIWIPTYNVVDYEFKWGKDFFILFDRGAYAKYCFKFLS